MRKYLEQRHSQQAIAFKETENLEGTSYFHLFLQVSLNYSTFSNTPRLIKPSIKKSIFFTHFMLFILENIHWF